MYFASTWAARGALCTFISTLALCNSGCGSKSAASGAQSPPPPSLCAPVRAEKARNVEATAVILPAEEYTSMQQRPVGSSTPLPTTPLACPAPALEQPRGMTVATETAAAATASAGKPEVYVMKQGDTLYGIARKYNVKPKDLIAANSFKDPNHVLAGTKVRIP